MTLKPEISSGRTNASLSADDTNSRGNTSAPMDRPRACSAAFEEIWRTHATQLLGITHRITRNREDAEDALQDSFLRAYVHLHSFDGRSSLTTWLTRIAINSALLILRKRASTPDLSLDDHGGSTTALSLLSAGEQGPSPEKKYSQAEQQSVVRSSIQSLRPSARRTLELRVLQNHSVKETAAEMGISISATKSRIFQAKAALRKSLGPKLGRRPRATEQLYLSPA